MESDCSFPPSKLVDRVPNSRGKFDFKSAAFNEKLFLKLGNPYLGKSQEEYRRDKVPSTAGQED